MKVRGYLLAILLTAGGSVFAQTRPDSTFSLFINSSIGLTHANDSHINRWLEKYGYPAEPHVPTSLNFEIAAIPADSRLMYTLRISEIVSSRNLTSYNFLGGLYVAAIKAKKILLLFGAIAGYHVDIITLNGQLPPDYQELATQYNTPLALRRPGLSMEPAMRVFWYPIRLHNVQVGVFGGVGYDIDLNSRWRLGYYSNDHGRYSHFKRLNNPNDQEKVSEYGFSLSAGVSFRFNLL